MTDLSIANTLTAVTDKFVSDYSVDAATIIEEKFHRLVRRYKKYYYSQDLYLIVDYQGSIIKFRGVTAAEYQYLCGAIGLMNAAAKIAKDNKQIQLGDGPWEPCPIPQSLIPAGYSVILEGSDQILRKLN